MEDKIWIVNSRSPGAQHRVEAATVKTEGGRLTFTNAKGEERPNLFVVVRQNLPVVSRLKKQVHAGKNHSFLVFQKTAFKKSPTR